MSIEYKIIKTARPGVKGGGEYSYYPRVCNRKKMDLDELAKRISGFCTLHEADVYATLIALSSELPELLLNNHSIQMGDFGIFSLHASGAPSATPNQVNATKITGVKVAFRPGVAFKRKLNKAEFRIKK